MRKGRNRRWRSTVRKREERHWFLMSTTHLVSNVRVCFSISVHFHHFDEHDVSLNSKMGFACCLLVKDPVSNYGR